MSGAKLIGAVFNWANLGRANLSGADLLDAALFRVNLSGATLRGATFSELRQRRDMLEGQNAVACLIAHVVLGLRVDVMCP
jgi:uncharacterized protein YjbI with pentapeptide repeats